jgi:hypothetical protein
VFLISDCNDTGFEKAFRLTAKKHDLTVLRISDPAEDELPDVGLVTLRDPETGKVAVVNSSDRTLRERWRKERQGQSALFARMLKGAGIDLVEFSTNGPVIEPLARLFNARRKRA